MSWETVSLDQVGDDGGLNGTQNQEKWSYLKHISKIEVTGFSKGTGYSVRLKEKSRD